MVMMLAAGAPLAVASPNILVIIADDLGVDAVDAYADDYLGHRDSAEYLPDTETVDGLAAAGLRFTQAWANPLCSPTRAGILTGRHAFRTGVGVAVPTAPGLDVAVETTLAGVLADTSTGPDTYTSGYFGKWHLGTTGESGTPDFLSSDGSLVTIADTAPPIRAGFDTYAGDMHGQVADYYGWTRVFAEMPGSTQVQRSTEYATWGAVDDSLDWIGAQTGPWFAVVAFNAAHTDGTDGRYEANDVEAGCHTVTCLEDGSCADPYRAAHQAVVECMDFGVAELLAGIPDATLADTMIVFVGDNGSQPSITEGPFAALGGRKNGGKGTVYQTGVMVPLIVTDGANWIEWRDCASERRADGRCALSDGRITSPGREVDATVHTVDLFATAAELAGHTPTTGDDSVSFASCLTDTDRLCPTFPTDRALYTEMFDYQTSTSGVETLTTGQAAVRRGRYKLVLQYIMSDNCVGRELYDLRGDPFEYTDIGGLRTAARDALTAELEAIAPTWLAGVGYCN